MEIMVRHSNWNYVRRSGTLCNGWLPRASYPAGLRLLHVRTYFSYHLEDRRYIFKLQFSKHNIRWHHFYLLDYVIQKSWIQKIKRFWGICSKFKNFYEGDNFWGEYSARYFSILVFHYAEYSVSTAYIIIDVNCGVQSVVWFPKICMTIKFCFIRTCEGFSPNRRSQKI